MGDLSNLKELIRILEKSLQVHRIFIKIYLEKTEIYLKNNYNIYNNSSFERLISREKKIVDIISENQSLIISKLISIRLDQREELHFSTITSYFNKIIGLQKKVLEIEQYNLKNKNQEEVSHLSSQLLKSFLEIETHISKSNIITQRKYIDFSFSNTPLNPLDINKITEVKNILKKSITDINISYWFNRKEEHNPFGNLNERANYCFAKSDMLIASSLWASGIIFPLIVDLDLLQHLKESNDFYYSLASFFYGLVSVQISVLLGAGLYTIKSVNQGILLFKKENEKN